MGDDKSLGALQQFARVLSTSSKKKADLYKLRQFEQILDGLNLNLTLWNFSAPRKWFQFLIWWHNMTLAYWLESNSAQTVTKSCPSMADNSSMVPCNAPRMVALMKTVPRTPRMVQPVMVRRPRVPRAGGFELPQEEEEEEPQEKLPSRLAIPSATSASAWSSYQASTSASASTSAWCQSKYQYKCLCKYQCHCQN